MSDLREALEVLDAKPNTWWGTELEGWTLPIIAAARQLLALTETGPDYEAAKQAYEDAPVPIRAEDFVRRIVDAALADYLTEEETDG